MEALVKTTGRRIMGRLAKGDDLLRALGDHCAKAGITLGEVRAIGAVTKARVGFYDQSGRVYTYLERDEDLEILSLIGNVSLKDGAPFVHAHVVFGDAQGKAWGGHLAEGCPVFACEFEIQEYQADKAFERGLDKDTGLFLWVRK